jgi:hypothetical protein
MESQKFTDFLVTGFTPDGFVNPEALDRVLHTMGGATLLQESNLKEYTQENGYYVMRVFGSPGYIKFACEHQGYCRVVGERSIQPIEAIDAIDGLEFMYAGIAAAFAEKIEKIFESEDSLKECFAKHYRGLEFSRTDHWPGILFKEMDAVWRERGPNRLAGLTPHDRFTILNALSDYLDFNLYSQVALNLQNWSVVTYQGGNVEEQIAKIATKWEKYSNTPLSHGATMVKDAFRPQDMEFNKDLSVVKSLKTISGITPDISFRVSPKGSTPAFSDSQNFSTIGIGGDQYVTPISGYTVWYVAWKTDSTPYILTEENGGFKTPGISYPFFSKSGGQILNGVLFARGIAFSFWTGLGAGTTCMPRMNSVMIVTPQKEEDVKTVFTSLQQPMLELFRDKRSY